MALNSSLSLSPSDSKMDGLSFTHSLSNSSSPNPPSRSSSSSSQLSRTSSKRSGSELSRSSKKSLFTSTVVSFDAFIQCAMREEADYVLTVFEAKRSEAEHKQRDLFFFPETNCAYLLASTTNIWGENLIIGVGVQSKAGLTATSSYMHDIRPHINTRYWFMCGILGGLELDTRLGDVVVADRGYILRGKAKEDENIFDTNSFEIDNDLCKKAENNQIWHKYRLQCRGTSSINLPPPLNWCVLDFLHTLASNFTDAKKESRFEELKIVLSGKVYAPRFEEVRNHAIALGYVEVGENGSVLTPSGLAYYKVEKARCGELSIFPPQYKTVPKVTLGAVATTDFVREDLRVGAPMHTALKKFCGHRKTVGVEMEIGAFYEAHRKFGQQYKCLAVKGVCDLANSSKDDFFHEVAGENAAAFLLGFIICEVRPAVWKSDAADNFDEIDASSVLLFDDRDCTSAGVNVDAVQLLNIIKPTLDKKQAYLKSSEYEKLESEIKMKTRELEELQKPKMQELEELRKKLKVPDFTADQMQRLKQLNEKIYAGLLQNFCSDEKNVYGAKKFILNLGVEMLTFSRKEGGVTKRFLIQEFGEEEGAKLFRKGKRREEFKLSYKGEEAFNADPNPDDIDDFEDIPLQSRTTVQSARYSAGSRMLEIVMNGGTTEPYTNVPRSIVDGLRTATSAGSYYNTYIRGAKYKNSSII